MTNNKTSKNFGFTLVEMIVVVAIIALIAVIAVPATLGIIQKSNEQNDLVLASTYSSYMQKFATEKAGSAEFYENIDSSGEGSEYAELLQYSGTGAYPGVNKLSSTINDIDDEEEIWKLVRKQACIAIKAYGNVELADENNYFINRPSNKDMAFVYYYLTGKIEIKKISDMKTITSEDVKNGAVDTEDYWVFLDREGGSGKAAGSNTNQKDFFVQIYQYGISPNTPLNGVTVTLTLNNGKTLEATTDSTGLVVFRDVTDELDVAAEMLGAMAFPNAEYYPQPEWPNSHAVLTGNYVGNSHVHAYTIFLKVGTLGSLQFNEQIKIYDYNANKSVNDRWTTVSQIIGENTNEKPISIFSSEFVKKDDSPTGRNESYLTNFENNNPLEVNPQELLGNNNGAFRFLMYGDYGLKVTDSKGIYKTYTEDITSKVFGIDNTANPKHNNASSPYPYAVTLKRNSTIITGTIASENIEQPLHDTYDFFRLYDNGIAKDTVEIKTYVYAVNNKNPNDFFCSKALSSPTITTDKNGKQVYVYEYTIDMVDTSVDYGKDSEANDYSIYLVTNYGTKINNVKKLYLNEFKNGGQDITIKGDGSYYILKANASQFVQVNIEEVARKDATIEIYEKNSLYLTQKKYIGYTATLSRMGYSTSELIDNETRYTVTVDPRETTIGTFKNVRKGFYYLSVDYDAGHESIPYGDNNYIVFVDENNDFKIVLPDYVPSKPKVEYTFTCTPAYKDANGNSHNYSNKRGMLSSHKIGRVQQDGIEFRIFVNGCEVDNSAININATYADNGSVQVTFFDTPASHGIVITSSVSCFYDGNYSNGSIIDSNCVLSFKIYRNDTESTSNTEHIAANWYWTSKSGNNKHWQQCQRCDGTRLESNHFVYREVGKAGEKTNDAISYYAKSSTTYRSDNNTSAGSNSKHIKHCNICGMYDLEVNCSADTSLQTGKDGWTYVYNHITGSSTVNSGSHSHYSISLDGDNSSVDEAYHYTYCEDCNQRIGNGPHQYKVTSEGSCISDRILTCEYCNETDTEPADGHNYAETFYYSRTPSLDNCLYKVATKSCSDCGDTPYSNSASVVYAGQKDTSTPPSTSTAYSRKYFDVTTHNASDTHSNYCTWGDKNACKCITGFVNKDSTGSAADGELGYIKVHSDAPLWVNGTRKSGSSLVAGKQVQKYFAESGKWCIRGSDSCVDSPLPKDQSVGTMFTVNNGTISITNTYDENNPMSTIFPLSGNSPRSTYNCCAQFTWPTNATNPQAEDNAFKGQTFVCASTIIISNY